MITTERAGARKGPGDTTAPVRRFRWENTPAPAPAEESAHEITGRTVTVIGAAGRVLGAVSAALAARGAKPWQVGDPGVPDAIVDLTFAGPFDPHAPHAADDALVRTLTVLRHCYEDWAAETDTRRLAYLAVTYLGGHAGYGDDPIHQPLGGIWAGLAKTVHRELPTVTAKIVDVARPDLAELPDIVAAELYAGGPAEIGYLHGVRHMLVPRPRAVADPVVRLGTADVVLVCGGGTGIGFALAVALARRHGCRVVVSGRANSPDGTEEWLRLDDAGFDEYRRRLIREAAGGRKLRDVRRTIGRLRQLRELHANLRAVEAEGLSLRYLPCDINDPSDLAKLVDELGPDLSGVVYLAGVDRPARLPSKSDSDFLAGVAVKVAGFLRVFTAVRHRQLKFFCNSGSLTGRLGGMVGELDYAAANDALSRLGLWARQASGLDVLTVCWPLWQGLSVSANVDAALRYMPAMDPAEGLERWCAELVAPHSGEVAFIGPIGEGIDLTKAGQFIVERTLPGFDAVYPKIFHRGEPAVWRPGERLVSSLRFTAATTPAAADFRVDGAPALPVTVLLENVLRTCEWLTPHVPCELTDIEVDPAGLQFADGSLQLERHAVTENGEAVVVVVRGADPAGRPVAGMTVRCRELPAAPPVPDAVSLAEPADVPPSWLRWIGAIVPVARWQRHACGTLTAPVRPCAATDLWAAEPAPAHLLPVAALENILRMAFAGHTARGGTLRIGRIAVYPERPSIGLVLGEPSGDTWYAVDRHSSRVALVLQRPNHRH